MFCWIVSNLHVACRLYNDIQDDGAAVVSSVAITEKFRDSPGESFNRNIQWTRQLLYAPI